MLVGDGVWMAKLHFWDRQDKAHRPHLAVLPPGSAHRNKGAKELLTKVKMNAHLLHVWYRSVHTSLKEIPHEHCRSVSAAMSCFNKPLNQNLLFQFLYCSFKYCHSRLSALHKQFSCYFLWIAVHLILKLLNSNLFKMGLTSQRFIYPSLHACLPFTRTRFLQNESLDFQTQ